MSHSFSDIQKTIKSGLARYQNMAEDDTELRKIFRNIEAVLKVEAELMIFSNHVRCLEDVMAHFFRIIRQWEDDACKKSSHFGTMFSQLQERLVFGDNGLASFDKLKLHLSSSRSASASVSTTMIYPDDNEQSTAQKQKLLQQCLDLLAHEALIIEGLLNAPVTPHSYEHDNYHDGMPGKSVDAAMACLNDYVDEANNAISVSEFLMHNRNIELVTNRVRDSKRSFFKKRTLFSKMVSIDEGKEALDYVNNVITRDIRLVLVKLATRLCPCIPRLVIFTAKLRDPRLRECSHDRLREVSAFQHSTKSRVSTYLPVYKWLCDDVMFLRDYLETAWACVRSSSTGTTLGKDMHRAWETFLDVWVMMMRSVVQCNLVQIPNIVAMAAALHNCRTQYDADCLGALEVDLRKDYLERARGLDGQEEGGSPDDTYEHRANELFRSRDQFLTMVMNSMAEEKATVRNDTR